MDTQSWIVIVIFVATLVGLIRFQRYPGRVFGCALLLICSFALEKTHFLRLIATQVIRPGFYCTWFRLFLTTAASSALLNNTAVVATLIASIRNNPYHPASASFISPYDYQTNLMVYNAGQYQLKYFFNCRFTSFVGLLSGCFTGSSLFLSILRSDHG